MRRGHDLITRLKCAWLNLSVRDSASNNPTATTLYVLLWLLLPVFAIHAVFALVPPDGKRPELSAFIGGLLFLTPLVGLILIRKGFVRLASIVYLAGIFVSYTLRILFDAGIHHVGLVVYIALPVSAAWLFGYSAALMTAATCIGSATVMAVLDTVGIGPWHYLEGRPVDIWFLLLESTMVGVLPVCVTLSSLRCALKNSQIEEAELRRAQDESMRTQKLESVGRLAAGVAHDFNNLLAGVLAEAELVEPEIPPGSTALDEIRRIKTIAVRGSEIVRELMVFAGNEATDFTLVNLSRVVAEMVELLKVSVSKRATLNVELGQVPSIRGCPAQLRQVVMNLILNASDALQEKDGAIMLTTSSLSADGAAISNGMVRSKDGYVVLTVADTGHGISEEQKNRIFDPFFTTKCFGRGLGLAVVHGIVRTHDGAIKLDSAVGHGTTFRIFFPCASEVENDEANIEPGILTDHLSRSAEAVLPVKTPNELIHEMIETATHPQRPGYSPDESPGSRLPDESRSYVQMLISMLEGCRKDDVATVQQNLHKMYLAQQAAVVESAQQKSTLHAATAITSFLRPGATLRWGHQGWEIGRAGMLLTRQTVEQLRELGFAAPRLLSRHNKERSAAFVHDLLSNQGVERLDMVSQRAFRANQNRSYFEYLNELRQLYQQHSLLRDDDISYPALVREKFELIYHFALLYLAGLLHLLGINEQLRQRLARSSLEVIASLIG